MDVIVATGAGGLAAKNATQTIPIVFAAVQDPVASGLVDSLAMPGGNVTGLSMLAPELSGKRLELLKEVVPRITRVAFLWGSSSPGALVTKKETQAAARALGLQCQSIEVRDSKDFDSAFEAATKERAQALLTNPGPIWGFKSLRARQPISNVSANSDFLSCVSTILAPWNLMLPKIQTFTIVVRTVPRLPVSILYVR